MPSPDPLRKHLLDLLRMKEAHLDFDAAVAGFPVALRGVKPQGAPHTPWQLLEHLRIAQWDILDFSGNPAYREMKWPDDYWPKTEAPPDPAAWDQSVEQFRQDLKSMEKLISDPSVDLTARIPHGAGQTLLREALLVADHNAYHLGQLVFVRKMLEAK
jgi:DinB superfamily